MEKALVWRATIKHEAVAELSKDEDAALDNSALPRTLSHNSFELDQRSLGKSVGVDPCDRLSSLRYLLDAGLLSGVYLLVTSQASSHNSSISPSVFLTFHPHS